MAHPFRDSHGLRRCAAAGRAAPTRRGGPTAARAPRSDAACLAAHRGGDGPRTLLRPGVVDPRAGPRESACARAAPRRRSAASACRRDAARRRARRSAAGDTGRGRARRRVAGSPAGDGSPPPAVGPRGRDPPRSGDPPARRVAGDAAAGLPALARCRGAFRDGRPRAGRRGARRLRHQLAGISAGRRRGGGARRAPLPRAHARHELPRQVVFRRGLRRFSYGGWTRSSCAAGSRRSPHRRGGWSDSRRAARCTRLSTRSGLPPRGSISARW